MSSECDPNAYSLQLYIMMKTRDAGSTITMPAESFRNLVLHCPPTLTQNSVVSSWSAGHALRLHLDWKRLPTQRRGYELSLRSPPSPPKPRCPRAADANSCVATYTTYAALWMARQVPRWTLQRLDAGNAAHATCQALMRYEEYNPSHDVPPAAVAATQLLWRRVGLRPQRICWTLAARNGALATYGVHVRGATALKLRRCELKTRVATRRRRRYFGRSATKRHVSAIGGCQRPGRLRPRALLPIASLHTSAARQRPDTPRGGKR